MSKALTWTHKDITLTGISLAGISTSIGFHLADVCFDVAQGFPFQLAYNCFLLTHGHLDHAGGLPYLIGQKAMRGAGRPQVYMPGPMLEPMREIMRLWGEIEDHNYAYDFHAVQPDTVIPLKGEYFAKPFLTFHRVPSTGYTVFQNKKRLREELRDVPQRELARRRRQGEVIEEHYTEAILSFTGDTKIEFAESRQVRSSRVLVMEVTYWDQKKSVANAREWGHIHIDELIPRLDDFLCEKILLIHTSARYAPQELGRLLDERVPARHRGRVELFPRL